MIKNFINNNNNQIFNIYNQNNLVNIKYKYEI